MNFTQTQANGTVSRSDMSNQTSSGFDEFAGNYEAALQQGLSVTGESKDYFAVGRIRFLERQIARLGERPARILDYGCGTGTSVPLLLSLRGAEAVTGVDISEESLKVAARDHGAGGNAVFATFQQLAPAGDMDLAFCNGVFHHIPVRERAGCMKYIFDSLRPGGVFAFWENNPWNPGTRYVMSRIPFDRDAVTLSPPESRRLSRSAGFEILFTQFVFFFPKSLGWLRWMEPAMSRVPLGGQYIVLCRKPVG
jgi:SAM-dependent methyltransferase